MTWKYSFCFVQVSVLKIKTSSWKMHVYCTERRQNLRLFFPYWKNRGHKPLLNAPPFLSFEFLTKSLLGPPCYPCPTAVCRQHFQFGHSSFYRQQWGEGQARQGNLQDPRQPWVLMQPWCQLLQLLWKACTNRDPALLLWKSPCSFPQGTAVGECAWRVVVS